jgi:hypothetical protein
MAMLQPLDLTWACTAFCPAFIVFLSHFAPQTVVPEQNARNTFFDAIVISDACATLAVIRIIRSFIGRNAIVILHLLLFQAEPSCARITIRVRASAGAQTDESARQRHKAVMMRLHTMIGLIPIGEFAVLKPAITRPRVA